MEKHINSTCMIYNKNGFTTGIVFRIQEYILFSYTLNGISNDHLLNIIFPSGILNWNYVGQYLIDQLNEYSVRYKLDTFFNYELSKFNLRIKAKPNITIIENRINFDTCRFNIDVNKLFLNLKPTTTNINNSIEFKINNGINDYFLYYDFQIAEQYNLNDLYVLTTYHNIDNNTLQQKVICKNITDNNTINEKILDFTIIGFDIPSDICISKYSNIDQIFSIERVISNYFTWPIDNIWYHFSNKILLIDKNSKNSLSSFMYYPQLIPIGTDVNIIGNSKYDNNSVSNGILSDNSFTGIYGGEPIVESLLLDCSAYKGYSGGPILVSMINEWNIDYTLNNLVDICQSYNGEIIYAITYTLNKFYLYKSNNYGKNFVNIIFNELNTNTNSLSIIKICVDYSGLYLYISISNSGIYFSNNQALNWSQKSGVTLNTCIDCSYDGSSIIASGTAFKLLYSNNFGTNITEIPTPNIILNIIKLSNNKIIGVESLGYLYISDITNINLIPKINDKRRLWSSVDIKNGVICATTQKGEVFISNDNGINFNKIISLPLLNYTSVSIDKNGENIFICGNKLNDNINMDLFMNSNTSVILGETQGQRNLTYLTGDIKINSSYIYISNNAGKNWRKDYSTDVKYIFNKILISSDFKSIIAMGNFNIGYERYYTNKYFLQSFINNENYKIIGMLVGGASKNKNLESANISISFHIIHFVMHQIYYKYIELSESIKNNMNLFIKYVISGFPKVYLGIKYNHFHHYDLIKNPSLITIFNTNKIFGGLWMNNFIKGFNFVDKQFIYDILEPEKKNIISIQNPLINTKLWKIFHEDLSSNYPILLTKIIYYNFWLRENIQLELGKFNTSNLDTQYDYYDINRQRNDTISFGKSEYFMSQRSISDFIYFYYYDVFGLEGVGQAKVFNDFVIEYIYFDIKKQIWTIGAEKVSPFLTDTREWSVTFPLLLYGYEKVNTLREFSSN